MPRLSKIGAAALAAFGWTGLSTVTASYLVVAGGGAGGPLDGGGGGAGGYQTGTTSLNPTQSYTVVVGAGGAGQTFAVTGPAPTANNGSNSQFGTLTASIGGGGGGSMTGTFSVGQNGATGGSGGGASYGAGAVGGSGTSGQGNAGGSNNGPAAGGGGGAGAAGSNGVSLTQGGAGGIGLQSSISGTATYYAGGGGGAADPSSTTQALGGLGGGGNSAYSRANNGTAGTQNTGGGGGGGVGVANTGYSGGSGVVIISYPAPQKFGGGIVTTSGSNTIHTFQTSGTLSPLSTLSTSYLIVAGGGAGGGQIGGGGGAGGYQTGSGTTIDTNSIYVVTVGAGGSGTTTTGGSGTNSSFSAYATASIGGGGGGSSNGNTAPTSGGSGGGSGGFSSLAGGTGTSGQGNAGGIGNYAGQGGAPNYPGGGGGGASAAGANSPSGTVPGSGGTGTASSISGTSTTYATGGTGGLYNTGNINGVAGTANTGNGGAGAYANGATGTIGGTGGSGIVIISYAGSVQQMAGGTVTISGGNVIHTFTSSGYLTPLKLVNNSLRFRSSASANLTRTPTVASNRTTWTWSAWVKRGSLGGNQALFNCYFANNDTSQLYVSFSSDNINVGLYSTSLLYTNAVYRDPAAWYHIVLAIDTTQATASNRAKLYVNGNQVTSLSSANYPAQNTGLAVNSANLHTIGYLNGVGYYFDGEQTEINFIDGQALTPNSFGTFNSYGVWQPITYGGSYGTNGFYLPFKTNSLSYAGSFNGSSQYLTFTDSSNVLDMGGATTSFEGFVYVSGSLSTGKDIFGKQGGSASWSTSNGWEYILYISSAYKFTFQYNNAGSPATLADPIARNIGQWYWVVVATDASNNISMFVDGVKVATGTNAITKPTTRTTMWLLAENGPSGVWLGSASNFRFVSGSNAYSPTATSLTVPTTNLTAVTGTQLLTLQNATIIDNSTNAFSITNNGSVTTAQTYPFSAGYIFNDQGPAGNNWTPNNISGASGSTLDYMTDVPTLTSATAANYAVSNPLLNLGGNVTVSNGNLTQTRSGTGNYIVPATQAIPAGTGKWYWELYVTTVNASGNWNFGVIYSTINNGTWNNNVDVYWNATSGIRNRYGTASTGTTWTVASGDLLGFALDATTGNFSVYKNGTLVETWNSAVDTAYSHFPFASCYSTGEVFSYNFGQQGFTYTPPTGFVALNTYNL